MSTDSIALFWYLRDHHPDPDVRAAAAGAFRAQVEASDYADLRADARPVLVEEQGTAIEPFELEEQDITDACDLLCLAAAVDRELLVVSRDKLEPQGGLQLRVRDGAIVATYVERRADRVHPPTGQAWRFAPGLVDPIDGIRHEVRKLEAWIYADDRGFVVRYGPLKRELVPAHADQSPRIVSDPPLTSMPRWHSRAVPIDRGHYAEIWPATPEDAIQVTALIGRKASVVVTLDEPPHLVERIGIVLIMPDGGLDQALSLPVVPVLGDGAFGAISRWLLTDNVLDVADRFEPALMAALVQWFGVAPRWVHASLHDRLL